MTDKTSMVERVARAMAERPRPPTGCWVLYDECSPETKEQLLLDARAAFVAIRECTKQMEEVGDSFEPDGISAKAIFQAMIDEALKE